MSLTTKNILLNLEYYALSLVVFPGVLLLIEMHFRHVSVPITMRVIAAVLALPALALQIWSIILQQREGLGTPSPARPTRRLVTSGPYAVVRNPLNIGELLFFSALALWFGSWLLAGYAVLAAILFHLFIVKWEEPRNRRDFGEAYETYRSRVPRWLPRSGSTMPK